MKSLKNIDKVNESLDLVESFLATLKEAKLYFSLKDKKYSVLAIIDKVLENKAPSEFKKALSLIQMVSDEAKISEYHPDFEVLVKRAHKISENFNKVCEKVAKDYQLKLKNDLVVILNNSLKNKSEDKTKSYAKTLLAEGLLTNLKLERVGNQDYLKISFSKAMKSRIDNDSFLTTSQKKTKTKTFYATLKFSDVDIAASVKVDKASGTETLPAALIVDFEIFSENKKEPLAQEKVKVTGFNLLGSPKELELGFVELFERPTSSFTKMLNRGIFKYLYDEVVKYQQKELARLSLEKVDKKLISMVKKNKSTKPCGFMCHEDYGLKIGDVAYRLHNSYNQSSIFNAKESRTKYEDSKNFPKKKTARMQEGVNLHQFLLEPEKFREDLVEEEKYTFSKEQIAIINLFKNVVSEEQLEKYERVKTSIETRYPHVAQLILESLKEVTFFHHDKVTLTKNAIKNGSFSTMANGQEVIEETNVVCKGKLDLLCKKPSKKLCDLLNLYLKDEGSSPITSDDIIFSDIKFTADFVPDQFQKKYFTGNSNYFANQVGHYARSIEVIDEVPVHNIRCFYILIDSKSQGLPEINVLEIPNGDIRICMRTVRNFILSKACLFDGVFESYPVEKISYSDKGRGIQTISIIENAMGSFKKQSDLYGLDFSFPDDEAA